MILDKGGGSVRGPKFVSWNFGNYVAIFVIMMVISTVVFRIKNGRWPTVLGPSDSSESRRDRRLAAFGHLGIPLYGPFLPLLLKFSVKEQSEFLKEHFRVALRYQLFYIGFYFVFLVLSVSGAVSPWVLLVGLAVGAIPEFANAARALRGLRSLTIRGRERRRPR